jgi:hypothetical protein
MKRGMFDQLPTILSKIATHKYSSLSSFPHRQIDNKKNQSQQREINNPVIPY